MESLITDILAESLAVKERTIRERTGVLSSVADAVAESLAAGRKLLIFGNGGSAADAQHIAAEFVNRFRMERPPLAALALTTDTSALTAIGNDYAFAQVFSKQVRALGRAGDVALGISTSGNSENVVAGLQAAREAGLRTIGMTGRGGGKLRNLCDLLLDVDSEVAARIQETHITMAHILCELVDRMLFAEPILPQAPSPETS
ncbi:MAG: D-sedoheptulose 7-phosphate isomerase [Desulfococcaceae bacterium]